MLSPAELVTDLDLIALDRDVLTGFGVDAIRDKRRAAVLGWLWPRLESAGYDPRRHRARREPVAVVSSTAAGVVDETDALRTWDGPGVVASETVGAGALYVGTDHGPPRGLFVDVADQPNSTAGVFDVAYWSGDWSPLTVSDGTIAVNSVSLGRTGYLLWPTPDNWIDRPLSGSIAYWVRLRLVGGTGAPARLRHVSVLVQSRLTFPAAQYTLSLLYAESGAGTRGRWAERAQALADLAQRQLDLVLPHVRAEFDVDESGALGVTDIASVTPPPSLFTWERG
jgi:hypothetical protein